LFFHARVSFVVSGLRNESGGCCLIELEEVLRLSSKASSAPFARTSRLHQWRSWLRMVSEIRSPSDGEETERKKPDTSTHLLLGSNRRWRLSGRSADRSFTPDRACRCGLRLAHQCLRKQQFQAAAVPQDVLRLKSFPALVVPQPANFCNRLGARHPELETNPFSECFLRDPGQ